MKRLLLPLLCLALAGHARDKAPDGLYVGYTGFALPADPVLPAREIHPSLWFKADDLASLKARLTADDFSRLRWTALQKLADLNAPIPAAPAATGKDDKNAAIHKYYGAVSISARAHALMALLAEDGATRAAHRQRAEELLLRAYDGPIFDLDSGVKSSAVDEIYRGSWLQNYAHAYDCIQPTLSHAVDRQVRERLAREAQCVYDNLYIWTPGGPLDSGSPHNHLSKPAWGLGSIALALSSDPRAKAWLARALEATNRNTRYFFSGDGLYREGSHYLMFSLTNFVPFLYHYRNVSGVDGFPVFQPVFEAMVATRNSRGWLPNIEDSYLRPTPTQLVAGAYRQAKTFLHPTAPLAEILTWSYANADLKPFEGERRDSGLNYTGASWDYPLEIDELLTRDAALRPTAPTTAPNIFLTGGQTVFRDSWTNRGAGQRYLLFHGVAVADNHNHDDQLSFIVQAEGQMMASDCGYSRGTYEGTERTAWYNQPQAHNTLTYDGEPADKQPTNATPPVSSRVDQPGLAGEEKTAYFGKKAAWHRAIFFIGGDYYAVIDRLDATQPGAVKAFLHGGRGALKSEGSRRTWQYTADRYGPAAQLHTWIAAPGATVTEKQGELTYIKGDYAEFPYLELSASESTVPWITLLKPAAAGDNAPFTVADHSTPGYAALLVTTATERTCLVAARRAGPKEFGDISTNAELAVIRRDAAGKLLGYFARGGTYLQVGGQNLPITP